MGPLESRQPVSELDEVLAPAVAAAQAADVSDEVVRGAIERLVALRVAREPASPERTVRGRLALLAAAAAALVVASALLLGGTPAAGAEVAAAMGLQAPPASAVPPATSPRALLIAHVTAVLGAYLAFALAWVLASFPPLLLLFAARPSRFNRATLHASLVLVPVGAALLAIGIVLGGVWAQSALGRFWGWDVREAEALLNLALAGAWAILAWRLRSRGLLVAALAGAGFWTMVTLRWLTVLLGPHSYGLPPWRTALALTVCGVLLNAVLLAAGDLLSRKAA